MPPRLARFSAIRSAFSNRNYAIYVAGNSISLLGYWVQRLAVGWLAWELTESGFWLGAIAFVDLFPVVLIGPFAGVLADRVDPRRILQICQGLAMLQAATLCVLTALDVITIEILLGLSLFLGIAIAVNQPARLSLVHSLVRPEDITTAVALNSVIFNSARFIGPACAGLVITGLGVTWAFAINSVSYGALIVAVGLLRLPPKEAASRKRAGVFDELGEGMRYAFGNAAILPLLLLFVAASMLARPMFELLPGFADAVFHRGAGGLAMLTSAVGLGAIVGGVWLAQRGTVVGLTRLVLTGTGMSGVLLLVFTGTDIFWLAMAATALTGVSQVVCGVGVQTLIQTSVAGHMRGRVLSLWGIIARGGPAVGALIMGWASGYLGLRWPVAAGGVLCILAALLLLARRRRMEKLLEK